MQEGQPDPFLVLGKYLLFGISSASADRVRAFYEGCGPFSPSELKALETVGMDLFQDRGRWVGSDEAWLRPTPMWAAAVNEARGSIARRSTARSEEFRSLAGERMAASADYRAAEARARAAGRLWGRWTRGYREARERAAALKVVHEEGLDEAGTLLSQEEKTSWLLDWLAERTEMAANVVSVRWTQRSCVGHFELGISFLELPRYAAARVIGQTTVALMLNGLISDDSYGRLLEPWHQSMARPPLPLDGPIMLDDPDVGTPARPIVPPASAAIAPPDREGDIALRLAALLELVHRADGMERIEYRDQVAAFRREAIEPMSGWLADPRLGAFAARVLGKIALTTDVEAVHDALRKRLPDISAPSVRDDVQGILHKLEPAIQLRQTQEWMAAQATRVDGAQWTSGDAERLVDKVERLDARRQAAGKPRLSARNREHALAIQFKGFGTRPYTNHCWTPGCGGSIDSEINARCDACNMFFCDSCGACMCGRG